MESRQAHTAFKLEDHLNVTHVGGVEHYQFQGKMPLDILLIFLAKHFATSKMQLSPEPIIVALAWDSEGHRWVMNRARVDDEDVSQVVPDPDERAKLWEPRMNIYVKAIRFYNPWRDDEKKRHLPIAFARCTLGSSPIVTALDCDADEAAGLIHEVLSLHILGYQPHYEVVQFVNSTQPNQANAEAHKPSKKSAKPVFEVRRLPSWFHPGT